MKLFFSMLCMLHLMWTNVATAELKHPEDIHYGAGKSIALYGLADYQVVRTFLAQYGLEPNEVNPGFTLVGITINDVNSVEGCGCPNAFKEAYMMFSLQPFSQSTRYPVTAAFLFTDHIQRMISMGTKYGFQYNLSNIDFNFEAGDFSLVDTTGNKFFEVNVTPSSLGEFRNLGSKLVYKSLGVTGGTGPIISDVDVKGVFASSLVSHVVPSINGGKVAYTMDQGFVEYGLDSDLGKFLFATKFYPVQIDLNDQLDIYQSKNGSLEY